MFRLRSVRSIVIAPANTGKDKSSKMAVKITDHGNKGVFSDFWSFVRMFSTVAIKLAAPRMDLAPAKCREKMAMSTGGPLWAVFLDSGG